MNRLHTLRAIIISIATLGILYMSLGHENAWGWAGTAGLILVMAHLITALTSTMQRFRHRAPIDILIDLSVLVLGITAIATLPNLALSLAFLAAAYQFLSMRHQILLQRNKGLLKREAARSINAAAPLSIIFGLTAIACLLLEPIRTYAPPVVLIVCAAYLLLTKFR